LQAALIKERDNLDRKEALREALNLGFEDDVFITEDDRIFIVERKKSPGVYGFCNSIPDVMEVYMVVTKSELSHSELYDRKPDHIEGEYLIFKE